MEEKLKTIRPSNPLLQHFKTNFESIPFDKIKPKDFIPAIKKGINLDSIKRPLKKIQQCSHID